MMIYLLSINVWDKFYLPPKLFFSINEINSNIYLKPFAPGAQAGTRSTVNSKVIHLLLMKVTEEDAG